MFRLLKYIISLEEIWDGHTYKCSTAAPIIMDTARKLNLNSLCYVFLMYTSTDGVLPPESLGFPCNQASLKPTKRKMWVQRIFPSCQWKPCRGREKQKMGKRKLSFIVSSLHSPCFTNCIRWDKVESRDPSHVISHYTRKHSKEEAKEYQLQQIAGGFFLEGVHHGGFDLTLALSFLNFWVPLKERKEERKKETLGRAHEIQRRRYL